MTLVIWYHASVLFFIVVVGGGGFFYYYYSDYEVIRHFLIKILCIFRWILNKQADQDDHHLKKIMEEGRGTSPEPCTAACSNFQWCIETANNV